MVCCALSWLIVECAKWNCNSIAQCIDIRQARTAGLAESLSEKFRLRNLVAAKQFFARQKFDVFWTDEAVRRVGGRAGLAAAAAMAIMHSD